MNRLKYFKGEKLVDLVRDINKYAEEHYLEIVSVTINDCGEAAVLVKEIYKGD